VHRQRGTGPAPRRSRDRGRDRAGSTDRSS